jgi:hypothetical protein
MTRGLAYSRPMVENWRMQANVPFVDISDALRLQWPLFAVFGGTENTQP